MGKVVVGDGLRGKGDVGDEFFGSGDEGDDEPGDEDCGKGVELGEDGPTRALLLDGLR